ncbi:uncharacterized protein JCM6883_002937 [Sporobolomyces salmoneus]|uniref:uncharacterized protein n=1 Tax=Sporobolomyces salmoneus TaxID=183962 RepID=UPI00317FC12A
MAKRRQAALPSEPPQKRQTRSSGPPEQTPSLSYSDHPRSNRNRSFAPVQTTYDPRQQKLRVIRKPAVPSLESQSVYFNISDDLSRNDDARKELCKNMKIKVKETITAAEGAVNGRELAEAEFVSIVREAGEEMGLGRGNDKKGLIVTQLEPSRRPGAWKLVTDHRTLGTVDEKDFNLDVITNQRLETSVPPTQRSTSYERAISSMNNIALRGLSLLTALSSLAADALFPRTNSRWNETFLLEINKYRKPLRKIVYDDHVKVVLRNYSYGTLVRCRRRQAGAFTDEISIGTTGTRLAEVVEIYEGLMESQESGELSWEEVKRVQEEWKAGRPPSRMSKKQLRMESKAESGAMVQRVMKSVRIATEENDQYRHASPKQRETLSKHIVKKYVSTEVVENNVGGATKKQRMETIRSCLTGETLLSLPASGTARQAREFVANSEGTVSIDHLDQMVIGLVNGEVIPVMNSKLNLGPISPQLNMFKYRWPCSQLAFMFAGISISDGTNGVTNDNTSLLAFHSRLLKLSKAAYKCHRMPCPRHLRGTLPVSRIKDVLSANTAILKLLGIKFATDLPTFDDYLEHMGITAEDFDEFANEQLQQMSDEEFLETGAQLDIDSNPPVRPGNKLNSAVTPAFREQIREVSKSIDGELKDKYNMTFKKTREGEGSGIIALTSNGTESVGDVCRLLLKWAKSNLREDYGFGGDNPWVTLYANSICFVADSILVKRKYDSFDASTKVFFHDPINPGLPLDLPPDSKHPFMPSISSHDHPKHRHGWKDNVPVIQDLTFKGWSASRNTMRLSTAASNLGDGQGNSTAIMHNRESLRKSIEFFRNIPETGYDSFLKTLFDPSPAGNTFVDTILTGINNINASRTFAPPPSADASMKRLEKRNEMEEDEGN